MADTDASPKPCYVRVLTENLQPTSFVGTLVRERITPTGTIVEVASAQRRLEVPRRQVRREESATPPPSMQLRERRENRDIDDVRMKPVRVEALDIGAPHGNVVRFPGAER